jgi:nucleolar pre-ribosomal-associated protein 1
VGQRGNLTEGIDLEEMGKRSFEQESHEQENYVKRQKHYDTSKSFDAPSRIFNVRDIHMCLAFHQDTQELQTGIQNLRPFLESIAYPKDQSTANSNTNILKEYLDSQKPRDEHHDAVHLKDLIQCWHFAANKNEDSLFSAVASILALLIRTLSSILDLREHGLSICRSMLLPDQARLIARGLSAPANKPHIISPSLRLVTEIVSFDGGAMGRTLYSKRDQTLDSKILARNLSINKRSEKDEELKRPSIRSNAIRYLLANLKLQDGGIKVDIIKQTIVMKSLFDGLSNDTPSQIAEVISTLDTSIIRNTHISWVDKGYLFGERRLLSLCSLLRADLPADKLENTERTISEIAQDFITHVCTSSEAGVAKHSLAWYLPENDSVLDNDRAADPLEYTPSLSSHGNRYKITVRNLLLADLAQSLRPHANDKELKLVLAIFRATPELIADFWTKKINFTFEPKLTSTWTGYASLVFESIRLPIPQYFGQRNGFSSQPPSFLVTMENILPAPLNQTVLNRCLLHGSPLVNLFGLRILALAIQKLADVLLLAAQAHKDTNSEIWSDWRSNLTSIFMRRCPSIREVLLCFQKVQNSETIQREAAARLLALYFEHLPSLALEEKVDITNLTTKLLQDIESSINEKTEVGMKVVELGHLINVSQRSADFSWWKRPEYLKYSPFITLLAVLVRNSSSSSTNMRSLVQNTLVETGILQNITNPPAADVLIESLRKQSSPVNVLPFIDECFQRFARRSIVYEDELDLLAQSADLQNSRTPVSIILVTLAEQWQYVEKTWKTSSEDIASWIACFITGLRSCGEDSKILDCIVERIQKLAPETSLRKKFNKSLKESWSLQLKPTDTGVSAITPFNGTSEISNDPTLEKIVPFQSLDVPNFAKIKSGDLDMILDSSSITKMILCLSSEDQSVRIPALQTLDHFTARILVNNLQSREILYLLLGSLSETAKSTPNQPLPFLVTTFATHAIPILTDPTNTLFPKLASFLTTRPSWPALRLVRHFLESTLLHEPTEDTDAGPWKEAVWLLTWLCDGLRIPQDGEILRQVGAWERLAAFGAHPSLGSSVAKPAAEQHSVGRLQARIRSLVVRLVVLGLKTGQTATLVTRVGIWAWLDGWKALKWIDEGTWEEIKGLVRSSKDQRVAEWSFGIIENGQRIDEVAEMDVDQQ